MGEAPNDLTITPERVVSFCRIMSIRPETRRAVAKRSITAPTTPPIMRVEYAKGEATSDKSARFQAN